MAITVTTKWIYPPTAPLSGLHHRGVVNFTANATDGTNEADVVKVDRSAIVCTNGLAPKKIAIMKIQYHIVNFEIQLYWEEAGGDETICFLSAGVGTAFNTVAGEFDWSKKGGMIPPAAPGVAGDGDIVLSTAGAADYSSYNITLEMKFKPYKDGETVI